MARSYVNRYTRDYTITIYSRATGADLTHLFGVSRSDGSHATGVILTSTSRRSGLGPDDARSAVIDYFIRRGYSTDFIADLRVVVVSD